MCGIFFLRYRTCASLIPFTLVPHLIPRSCSLTLSAWLITCKHLDLTWSTCISIILVSCLVKGFLPHHCASVLSPLDRLSCCFPPTPSLCLPPQALDTRYTIILPPTRRARILSLPHTCKISKFDTPPLPTLPPQMSSRRFDLPIFTCFSSLHTKKASEFLAYGCFITEHAHCH